MNKVFNLAVGAGKVDQGLEFVALSIAIDNPTNQWFSIDALGVFVPQNTIGAIYPLPGTTKAQFSFTAPPGQVQPPTIAGQGATVTFWSLPLPATAGVGMLGGRAPYYDRAPLDVVASWFNINTAPHASTARWSYTVPAGRKAYLEMAMAWFHLESAGDLAVSPAAGWGDANVSLTPKGGSITNLIDAVVEDVAPARSRATDILGASMELQPGDLIQGSTRNLYTATVATEYVSAKFTEFDV